jgi:hypothetical protein
VWTIVARLPGRLALGPNRYGDDATVGQLHIDRQRHAPERAFHIVNGEQHGTFRDLVQADMPIR